ncbi:response regulator [Methanosarcina hadiensis]|uniref:response regulator n=1 Tax=Methanosarcina hadiensis TaxID=3078083 RepID=UPI003977467F
MPEGRILIVEDEHIVAMGIKRMLKNMGYTLAGIASSGEDAVNKAESTFPDLVLMDIMLKGEMNGIEAAKKIKARSGLPVVYMTACSESKIVESAWKTGPSGYVVKPFDEKDLKKSIDVALRRHRMEKNELEKNSVSAGHSIENPEKTPEKRAKIPVKLSESVECTECTEQLQNLK